MTVDIYTAVAERLGIPRHDVKVLAHAYMYSGGSTGKTPEQVTEELVAMLKTSAALMKKVEKK
jgi:hypothetical protein